MGVSMEKETIERILINKSNELRVARIKGQKLYDLEIEQIDSEQAKVDNICNAEIVLPSHRRRGLVEQCRDCEH